MIKKYIFLIYLSLIFITNFSVNAMKVFAPIGTGCDLSSYQLPSKDTLKCLGVEKSRELVAKNQIQIDQEDCDQNYLDALAVLEELKKKVITFNDNKIVNLIYSNSEGEMIEKKDSLKKFIKILLKLSSILKTTVFHILIELKQIRDVKPFIIFLNSNKEIFDFDDIDARPQQKVTYSAHKNLTPLFYAVFLNDFEKSKTLIENGANIYVRNKFGYSLLHLAVFHKNAAMVKLILNRFREDKERDKKLKFDVLNDQRSLFKKTLRSGAEEIIYLKHTPLHFAVWRGDLKIINLLLKEDDLKINLQDGGGQTPLHILVNNYSHFDEYKTNAETIAHKLIEKGANPKILDKNNRSPKYYLDCDESVPLMALLCDARRWFSTGWF